jgi:histidinol-phosphate/aromatic aminotransferase/cobyric acid decarboxylase-like protein
MPGISIKGSNANMLLLDLGDRDAAAAASALAAKAVVVADATSFRGLEHCNMIRVSLRGRQDNQKLIAALEAIR